MLSVKETKERFAEKCSRDANFGKFLLSEIHEQLQKSSEEYAAAAEILDYITGFSGCDVYYEELLEKAIKDEGRLMAYTRTDYGGSEGIYSDMFIDMKEGKRSVFTLKTLRQDSCSIGRMGLMAAMLSSAICSYVYMDAQSRS